MNFKKFLFASAMIAMALVACEPNNGLVDGNDDDNDNKIEDPDTTATADYITVSGAVEGTWAAGSKIKVNGHINVPEGKSLTIAEGVEVIFDERGVGANHVPVEFTVDGALFIHGTDEKPVLLSVDEASRTEANIFAGLWGGIVATETCAEMVIEHAIIEYSGGQVVEGSPAATSGIYTAGDDAYPQITTTNINGSYVVRNSIIRNGWSDGIYLMGGKAIIADNIFAANGYDGAEAVNVKAGCTVDVAGNVMFSPNTNGLKLSSSGQSETRHMARINAYNNTIVNAGWRRDGEKGGCIYVEKNALVNVVNNLMVNCKFRAMTPNFDIPNDPKEGYNDKSVIDYNYYASGTQRSDIVFEEESGVAYAWAGYNFDHENYNKGVVDAHSIVATEDNLCDPVFVNFDINGVALTEYIYNTDWNFAVDAASPARQGAYTGSDITPFHVGGLTIGGILYTSPAIAPVFGINE